MVNDQVGKLIEGDSHRDAIHVAVAPVEAAETLKPGEMIGVTKDGKATKESPCGIVDPFLKQSVMPGQRFLIWLFPNTVTDIHHHWFHPAFPEAKTGMPERSFSEQWLRFYAVKMNSYDDPEEAFQRLIEGLNSGELFSHGSDLHGLYELDDAEDLRHHAQTYLGKTINWNDFSFSCSC